MKIVALFVLIFVTSSAFAQENNTNSSSAEKQKSFLVKGDFGLGFYPGMFGYLIYMHATNAFSYVSGLSLNADALYYLTPGIALGLNTGLVPILRMNESGVIANGDMIPFIASAHFEDNAGGYIDVGLGFCQIHGTGSTSIDRAYFVDLLSGENLGKSFDVWRGPYFTFSYAFGWLIDLSGTKTFGLDIFWRNYHIFGHPGIDNLEKLTQDVGIPGFLSGIIVNTGVGFYYKF